MPSLVATDDDSVYTLEVLKQSSWNDIASITPGSEKSSEDRYLGSIIYILSRPLDTGPDGQLYRASQVFIDSGVDMDRLKEKIETIISIYNSENELQLESYLGDDPENGLCIVVRTVDLLNAIADGLPQPISGSSIPGSPTTQGLSSDPWSLEALQNATWDDLQNWANTIPQNSEDNELIILVQNLSSIAKSGNPDAANFTRNIPKQDISSTTRQFLQKYAYVIQAFNSTGLLPKKVEISASVDDENISISLSSSSS